MKLIFAFLSCCIFIVSAKAQYTCNDRSYLKQQLAILDQSCGNTTVCKAGGYSGGSVEAAITRCEKSSYSCGSVSCNDNTTICKAGGYYGGSAEEAIARCEKNSYSCGSVSCN